MAPITSNICTGHRGHPCCPPNLKSAIRDTANAPPAIPRGTIRMAAFRPKLVRAYESETLSSTQAGEAGPRNTPEPPHPWTAKGTITKCYDRMAIGPKSQEEGSRIEKKKKKEKKKRNYRIRCCQTTPNIHQYVVPYQQCCRIIMWALSTPRAKRKAWGWPQGSDAHRCNRPPSPSYVSSQSDARTQSRPSGNQGTRRVHVVDLLHTLPRPGPRSRLQYLSRPAGVLARLLLSD